MKPFLIIKTGGTFPEFTRGRGDFEHWAARSMGLVDAEWICVNVQAGEDLPDPADHAGCLITGSHDMVTDDVPWIHATRQWIVGAGKAGLPMVGICFGHQIMAQAFGGEAGNHLKGPEIGTVSISLTEAAAEDPLFSTLSETFSGHATHTQCALTLPPDGVLLARNDYEPHQAFRYGDHVWGIQFHPEFDEEAMRFYARMQEDKLADLDAVLANVEATPESSSLLPKFVEYCRKR